CTTLTLPPTARSAGRLIDVTESPIAVRLPPTVVSDRAASAPAPNVTFPVTVVRAGKLKGPVPEIEKVWRGVGTGGLRDRSAGSAEITNEGQLTSAGNVIAVNAALSLSNGVACKEARAGKVSVVSPVWVTLILPLIPTRAGRPSEVSSASSSTYRLTWSISC